MFKKMSIRARLLIGFGIAIVLSAIVIGTSILGLQNTRVRYEDLISNQITTVEQIKDARYYINYIAREVRDFCLTTDRSNYVNIQSSIEKHQKELDNIMSSITQGYSAQDNYVSEWNAEIKTWESSVNEIVQYIINGDDATAASMIVNQCTPQLENLISKADAATDSMVAVRDSMQNNVRRSTVAICTFIIVLLVVMIIVLILFSTRITKSVVMPLDKMQKVMVAMSQGDLSQDCEYHSTNEFGVTADALRTSQAVLGNIIQDLDRALEGLSRGDFTISDLHADFPGELIDIKHSYEHLTFRMNDVMGQLVELGNQVASGAEQVSQGAQTLAQGATEQASSVEELSATVSDISTASKRNAETANRARELANEAGHAVEQSNEQMKEMLSAMDAIGSSSDEIRKIIKTIEDIAFQTNILALNAAVEAARAGTAGKGFAVVADEVRNLASKSAEASQNTATLIEKSIHAVEHGSALAGNTAAALEHAIGKVNEAVSNIDQITTAVGEEALAIQQITGGIDQISAVVQTNSATSEESAAAAEELSAQAQTMHALLSQFRMKDDRRVTSTPSAMHDMVFAANEPMEPVTATPIAPTTPIAIPNETSYNFDKY